jgi:dTDP-glucose 4,6-dehydratase
VAGTQCLLEQSRRSGISKFIQISTDEVYGSLGTQGAFREDTPLDPSSPYSASKASADMWTLSYFKTFGFPALVTRCSNNYGPFQFPEKLIRSSSLMRWKDERFRSTGTGLNVREWIFADEHSRAVLMALDLGRAGEVYNIGSGHEKTNLEVVREVLRIMGKPESLIQFVKDRPGHDRRYAIDCSKIQKEWGWQSAVEFGAGLAETIAWYQSRQDWIQESRTRRTFLTTTACTRAATRPSAA